jgi:hypothetical protein
MAAISANPESTAVYRDWMVVDAVPRNRSPLASATVSTLFFPVRIIFSAKNARAWSILLGRAGGCRQLSWESPSAK